MCVQEGLPVTWRNTVALATADGFTQQPGIRVPGSHKFAGDIFALSERVSSLSVDIKR